MKCHFFSRVKDNEINLFDNNMYSNLNSISTVLDRICTCKKGNANDKSGNIECNYGTYKDCKFRVGKQYHCILNPEGQLRKKRDLRHMQSLFSDDTTDEDFQRKLLVRYLKLC